MRNKETNKLTSYDGKRYKGSQNMMFLRDVGKVVRKGFSEKVTFELRSEQQGGGSQEKVVYKHSRLGNIQCSQWKVL